MYCPRCGTQNDDNNFKCTNCGTIIQQIPQANIPVLKSSGAGIIIAVIGGVFFLFMMTGILAAIAIPNFNAYRVRSYNASAQADLRNAATAQEGFYVDNGTYTDSIEKLENNYGLIISQDVVLQITNGNEDGYTMESFHKKGNKIYSFTGPGGTIESYDKDENLK